MLARIRLATGLPVSAHRLRHTGATAGARKGMPTERIQAKLRHTSPRATVGYIGLAAEINEHQSGLAASTSRYGCHGRRSPDLMADKVDDA